MPATPRLATDNTMERTSRTVGTCEQFEHFFTFRDGKIVKFQQYTDTAQFKGAASSRAVLSVANP